MADEITMASTTDTLEEVNEALGIPTPTAKPDDKPQTAAAVQEEAAETQQEEDKEEPKPRGEQRSHKRDPQKRINELTREKYDLKDQLEEARIELERLRTGSTKAAATEAVQATPEDKPTRPKPVSTDPKYKTYEEFTEDLGRWSAEQVIATKEKVAAEKAQTDLLKENFDNFNEQLLVAREKYDDWDEVASDKSIIVPKVCKLAAIEMENGPEVLYYLGKNKDVREHLLELNDSGKAQSVIMEMGRISDFLLSKSEEREPVEQPKPVPVARPIPVSAAPAPVKPVGGTGTRGVAPNPDEMSYQDFKRWRRQNGAR